MRKGEIVYGNGSGYGSSEFASADIIRGINIDFVTIGHAGNAADTTCKSVWCGS